MLLWTVRIIFVLLTVSLLLIGLNDGKYFDTTANGAIFACMFIIILGLGVDIWIPRKNLNKLAGLFFGVFTGLILAGFFILIQILIYEIYPALDKIVTKEGVQALLVVVSCYFCVVFVLQTKDDFRFIIPYVEFSKQSKGRLPLILDTSVIIDGRIVDIAETGFLNVPFIVPRFVLDELQLIADSADNIKRERGRRGLDLLNLMQANKGIDIEVKTIDMRHAEQQEPVDLKLVTAALSLSGHLITTDFNLNKVATIRGVKVLNINELAGAIKPVLIPGEILHTKIVKKGDQAGQGVGYMTDGTMVVADNGADHIGADVNIIVTRVLQTSAGRMVFGKI